MVSPEWTNRSGSSWRIVSYVRMPRRAGSIPQPWPAVSPAPHERHVPPAARRGPEVADDAFAAQGLVVGGREPDPVEDVPARGQAAQLQLGGEVGRLVGERAGDGEGPDERRRGGHVDEHATRPISWLARSAAFHSL